MDEILPEGDKALSFPQFASEIPSDRILRAGIAARRGRRER